MVQRTSAEFSFLPKYVFLSTLLSSQGARLGFQPYTPEYPRRFLPNTPGQLGSAYPPDMRAVHDFGRQVADDLGLHVEKHADSQKHFVAVPVQVAMVAPVQQQLTRAYHPT